VKTLNLQQAAELLHIHPVTLQSRAKAGVIPGARIGRRWVFVEDDVLAYLRAQYPRRALQGDKETIQCRSTNARIHLTGGSSCPTTDEQYRKALGLPTETKRGSTTTN